MKNCNLFNRPFFAIEQSKLDEMNATKKGSAFGLFVPSKTDNKYLYVSGMIKQNQSSMDDNSKIKLNMYKTDCSVDPNKLTKNIAMHANYPTLDEIWIAQDPVATAEINASYYYMIENIAVDENETMQGYGSIMGRIAEDMAKQAGYNNIYANRNDLPIADNLVYQNKVERNMGVVGEVVADLKSHIIGKQANKAYSNFLSTLGYATSENAYHIPSRVPRNRGYMKTISAKNEIDPVVRLDTDPFETTLSETREVCENKSRQINNNMAKNIDANTIRSLVLDTNDITGVDGTGEHNNDNDTMDRE